jgi:di/tricarboxylate transporter
LGTLAPIANFGLMKKKKGYMLLKFQNSCKIEVYEISCMITLKLLLYTLIRPNCLEKLKIELGRKKRKLKKEKEKKACN